MSDNTLEKLISTLKTEAIDASDKEAKEIIDNANAEAQNIIEEAKRQSSELVKNANAEAQSIISDGKSALEQAARNLYLSVQNDLIQLLSKVVENQVEKEFSAEFLKQAINTVIENVGKNVNVKLPDKMEESLAKEVISHFQGLTSVEAINNDPSVLSGFTVSSSKEGWSFEISTEEVALLLNKHLSPKWADLLKDNN